MKRKRKLLWVGWLAVGCLSMAVPGALAVNGKVPAFPGAEGGGMYTTGGRGGEVYEVTTLEDYGSAETPVPGSLRDAVSGSNRIIVFRVGGVIHLKDKLKIIGNNLTIAGQTAPGDGILITDYDVVFGNDKAASGDRDILNSATGNNIIMRYLRIRPGDRKTEEVDATWSRWHHDLIIDHCSFGWSTDETLSIYGNINTTVQWCLIGESLTMSKHSKGRHGYGAIFGGLAATAHHNLLVSHTSRAPRIDGQGKLSATATDFTNNVIYNWGFNSLYGGQGNTHTNVIGNYYQTGPGTQDYSGGMVSNRNNAYASMHYRIANPSAPGAGCQSYWYIQDNRVAGYPEVDRDNTKGVYVEDTANTFLLNQPSATTNRPQIEPAERAYHAVLAEAGATLPKRDWVDQRLVNDVKHSTGRFINTPDEAGGFPEMQSGKAPVDTDRDGMPDFWEKNHRLNPNDSSDGKIIAANGYSQVENYLNWLVATAEEHPHLNPDIHLITPSNNLVVRTGEPVVFRTDGIKAHAPGSRIVSVTFYANDQKLGVRNLPPFEFVWKGATEGTYYLSAVARDEQGYQTQSNIRVVHVNHHELLAAGWQTADLGSVPIRGNCVFTSASTLVTKGSGAIALARDPADDSKGSRDTCRYTYQRISGDATLVARVDDFTAVDNSAFTGLMIRKSLDDDAPMLAISLQLEKAGTNETGKAIVVKARNVQGNTLSIAKQCFNAADKGYWLKLRRRGDTIETAYSADGQVWTVAATATLSLGTGELYLGLAVDAAQNFSRLHNYNRAQFSEIGLTLE